MRCASALGRGLVEVLPLSMLDIKSSTASAISHSDEMFPSLTNCADTSDATESLRLIVPTGAGAASNADEELIVMEPLEGAAEEGS